MKNNIELSSNDNVDSIYDDFISSCIEPLLIHPTFLIDFPLVHLMLSIENKPFSQAEAR